MGDDTWMTVFRGSFEQNTTFPYDSFNVKDLYIVDEGVVRHLSKRRRNLRILSLTGERGRFRIIYFYLNYPK